MIADATEPRRLFVPRALVMLASLWIFCGWITLFGFHPPVQPQAASYGPSIRMLMALCGVGIAVGWPLLRLSGRPSLAPATQAAIDGLSLFVLIQVVIWPLRLVTNWTIARAVAVDACVAASILQTGALLAATQGSTSSRFRTVAMAAAAALVLLPGALRVIGEGAAHSQPGALSALVDALSAPVLLSRFSVPVPIDPAPSEHALVFIAFSAGILGWAVAFASLVARARRAASRALDPTG